MAKKTDTDHCKACGSDNLFSGHYDDEDLAVPNGGPDTRWTTFCNECGEEQ